MNSFNGVIAFLVAAIGLFLSFVGLVIVIGLFLAIPTMLLWYWLMPEIFGLTTITIWQAWGLNILSGIFFKKGGKSTDNKKTGKKSVILG